MKVRSLLLASTLVSGNALATQNIYGFLKTSYISALNTDNDYKPFFAKDNKTSVDDYNDVYHSQISVKQSRFGMEFENENKRVSAKYEFDFDGESGNTAGATKSSTGNFRTRILELKYKITDKSTISMGKRWDTFYALNPHTYSVTMVQLNQGNTGFLTEAFEYKHMLNEKLDLALQLETLGDQNAYKVSLPITTIKANYKASNDHTFGLAIKSGTVRTELAHETDQDINLLGTKIYYSGNLGKTNLRTEVYQGKNLGAATVGATLGNLSSTSINTSSVATGGDDIMEQGFYLSAKYSMDKLGIFGGFGKVEITNAEDTLSNDNKASNQALRAGVDYQAEENLTLFAEITSINTGYYNKTDDETDIHSGSLIDMGMMYKF